MDELLKRKKLKEWFIKNDLEIIDHAQGDPDTNMHEIKVEFVFNKMYTIHPTMKVVHFDVSRRYMVIRLWWSQFELYCL